MGVRIEGVGVGIEGSGVGIERSGVGIEGLEVPFYTQIGTKFSRLGRAKGR